MSWQAWHMPTGTKQLTEHDELVTYLLGEYRRLLRRAIAARIATAPNPKPHIRALNLLDAAFPGDDDNG